jgi:predicted DNA-binding transcriptional regulator AlpA
MSNTKLVRVKDVMGILGVSRSQVWKLTKDGDLNPVRLSPRVTAWRLADVEAYIASKAA